MSQLVLDVFDFIFRSPDPGILIIRSRPPLHRICCGSCAKLFKLLRELRIIMKMLRIIVEACEINVTIMWNKCEENVKSINKHVCHSIYTCWSHFRGGGGHTNFRIRANFGARGPGPRKVSKNNTQQLLAHLLVSRRFTSKCFFVFCYCCLCIVPCSLESAKHLHNHLIHICIRLVD